MSGLNELSAALLVSYSDKKPVKICSANKNLGGNYFSLFFFLIFDHVCLFLCFFSQLPFTSKSPLGTKHKQTAQVNDSQTLSYF